MNRSFPPRLFAALVLLLLASSGHARLGENEAQLVERYTKPIMRSPEMIIDQGKTLPIADNLHFKQGDWHIIARMTGGRCESITYLKKGEWTEEQFRHVLESNGGRSLWEERKTPTPKTHREWKRRDSATATWRMPDGITLSTPAFDRAREAVKKKAKADASTLPKI